MSARENWLTLSPEARVAFLAGRELGRRDHWMHEARGARNAALRRMYVRFARESNHDAVGNLREARERMRARELGRQPGVAA